jgi:predicted MFS family arabinose efflux permease
VGAYGFSASIGGLLAAWFIDRFDRKTALLALYAGFTTGTLLCAVAPGFWSLVLARTVAGAFGGIVAPLLLVIVGDTIPEMRRGRATGVVMWGFSTAAIAGLPMGILLGNRSGVRAPFGVLGVFSLIILLLVNRVLPRLRGHLGSRRQSAAETWAVLIQPAHLRAYVFMLVLVIGGFTISPHFSDYLVHNVGLEKGEVAYVYLLGGLVTFATLPLAGRFADRIGKRTVFRVMAGFTLVMLLVLSNLPPMPLLTVLLMTTLYWIFTSSRWVPAMALITSSVVPRYRGSFMSVNGSVQHASLGLAAVVAGAVVGEARSGKLTGYYLAGLVAAAATGISMALVGRLRVAEENTETAAAVDPLGEFPALEPARVAEATSAASARDGECPSRNHALKRQKRPPTGVQG